MTKIDSLTSDEIVNGQLPLNDLLDNSFYYPSSGFDGGIIKHYSKNIQSFIYCDYASGEANLINQLETFRGYKLLGHRPVNKEELIPSGWQMQPPPHVDIKKYFKYKDVIAKPFVHWAVYERLEDFDDNHGPKRFSLLYIGGEGVATYQALYWTNKKTAKALAIIQPGTHFPGWNWTDFSSKGGALAWVILNNEYGRPDTIFYGGRGNSGYNDFDWEDYEFAKEIEPYYSEKINSNQISFGRVTIWNKKPI